MRFHFLQVGIFVLVSFFSFTFFTQPLFAQAPGACAGGTCKSTGCLATETASGACSAGGTCCMPTVAGGGGTAGASATISLVNPLKFSTVEEVLDSLLLTLQSIIVILALVFLLIGAVMYITSAGNDKQITQAKAAILAALIGLALGLAAPSFLREIYNILQPASGPLPSQVAGALTLSQIAMNVLTFLLSIVGVLAVIMMVVGGISYLTAAGNEKQADTGKKIVTYAIIGIVVALSSLVLVTQLSALF